MAYEATLRTNTLPGIKCLRAEKDTLIRLSMLRIIAGLHTHLPGSSTTQDTRGPHVVLRHDCLFLEVAILPSGQITQCSAYRRPSRAAKRGDLTVRLSINLLKTLRASAGPDFRQSGSGIKPFSSDRGRVFAISISVEG